MVGACPGDGELKHHHAWAPPSGKVGTGERAEGLETRATADFERNDGRHIKRR